MTRVLIIAPSRKTHGGITSILNVWEKMPLFKSLKYYWLETQINSTIGWKLYYMFSSYLKGLFIIPFYRICHFHTVPGVSMIVQMPLFLWATIWRKKTIIHLHVGNQLLDYKDSHITKFVLNNATKVVVLADVWKQCMKETFGIDAEVVYNTIDVVPLQEGKKREKRILFAGYLTLNKGYDVVIKAFSKICKKYKDWTLLIVGAGELEEARALVNNLGIIDQVEFHGWASAEQMANFYETCSIYCFASYKEGFPMSALEAWQYKIPMVTTPVGGLVDVLKDGENALVFDFGDYNKLANQIASLIEDEILRKQIADKAFEMANENFSIIEVESSLRRLYQKCCISSK